MGRARSDRDQQPCAGAGDASRLFGCDRSRQPGRNSCRLGRPDEVPPLQRDRMAGRANARRCGAASQRRGRGAHPRTRRTAARSILFREQVTLAARQRRRGGQPRKGGTIAARHQRRFSARPTLRRVLHRCVDGLAHEPRQSLDPAMGPRPLRSVWRADRVASSHTANDGCVRRNRRLRRGLSERGRSAGSSFRARLSKAGRREDHLRHGRVRSGAHKSSARVWHRLRASADVRMAAWEGGTCLRAGWRRPHGGSGGGVA